MKKILLKKEEPSAKYWCKFWRKNFCYNWRKKHAKYGIKFGEKTSAKKENFSAKYGVKFGEKQLLLKLKEKTSAKYGIKSVWKDSKRKTFC